MHILKRLSAFVMAVSMLMTVSWLPAYAEDVDGTVTLSIRDVQQVENNGTTYIRANVYAEDKDGGANIEASSVQIYFLFPADELAFVSYQSAIPDRPNTDNPFGNPIQMTALSWAGNRLAQGNEKGYFAIYMFDSNNENHTIPNNSKIAELTFSVKSDAPKNSGSKISFGVHEDLGNVRSYMLKAYPDRSADKYQMAFDDGALIYPNAAGEDYALDNAVWTGRKLDVQYACRTDSEIWGIVYRDNGQFITAVCTEAKEGTLSATLSFAEDMPQGSKLKVILTEENIGKALCKPILLEKQ